MTDTITQTEQTFVENGFGTVTSRRVIYFREKGWFSGGSREDIPLQHVTSVRLETARSFIGGILLLVVGLALLVGSGAMKILGVVLIVLAVLLLWGSPKVVVNTAGRDLNTAKGFPWKRPEANSFVEALRKQLFDKSRS
jgi:hypothetical protein